MAKVSINGVQTDAGLALSEDISVGDYVIVHAGFILEKLTPEEAKEDLDAIRSAIIPADEAGPEPS
jgi:hydrogenase expression/formation protein HypC